MYLNFLETLIEKKILFSNKYQRILYIKNFATWQLQILVIQG